MEISLKEILIKELCQNYQDNAEHGVSGYFGKLNIRPAFQREFVYNEKQRNAVIETVIKGFPLNVMYWATTTDNSFELIDGQQRTISICEYVAGKYSLNERFFHSLTIAEKEQILNYKLMVYICTGTDKEKLEWFKTINIAGEKLTDQELRNAIYTGPWLTSAKTYFSKPNCVAYLLAKDYVIGSPIRQDLLQTALNWINNNKIAEYMSLHQFDPNANELWTYFKNVIDWVKLTFIKYRREMKGINWGELYNQFKNTTYDTNDLEEKIQELMLDDDVGNKKGIYHYVLTHNQKYLNLRAFSESQKRQAYEKQNGICPMCLKEKREKVHYNLTEMEADHIIPWCDGGKTTIENCQMLCVEHNRLKGKK